MTDTTRPCPPSWRAAMAFAFVASACSFVLAVLLTRTAWFRDDDPEGVWHVRAVTASAILLPAAVLLFAFGVQWAVRRRPIAALVALAPLPAWVIGMHLTRVELPPQAPPGAEGTLVNAHLLVNDAWFALLMLQMQGVQPFGGA